MSVSKTPSSKPNPQIFNLSFLVNPKSGGGQGAFVAESLPEVMDSFGFTASDWCCEAFDWGNLDQQLSRMLHSSKKLIAIGGDGTMSSVLDAYIKGEFKDVELGLIPLGTGNDLSRAMNIYHNFVNKGLINTLRKLIMAESRPFDLWKVGDKITLAAYVSAGYDARVAHVFHQDRVHGKIPGNSGFFNKLWYFKVGLEQIRYRMMPGAFLRIRDARGKEKNIPLEGRRLVLIGNVGSYAGGARPFDRSDFSDGMLEILSIKSFFHFMILMSTSFLDGPWLRWWAKRFLPSVHAVSAELFVPKGECVQVDGEPCGAQISGQLQKITYAGQAKILVLKDRL